MDNLYFLLNNILTRLFKELKNIRMTINTIKIIYIYIYIYKLYYASKLYIF